MNHTKVLVGLILFATANAFAMEDSPANYDDNTSSYQEIIYKLHCGICNEFMRESMVDKRIFHSGCMRMLADSDYVNANPTNAPKPWKKDAKQRKYGKTYYWKKNKK
jgi:hypothetical protein